MIAADRTTHLHAPENQKIMGRTAPHIVQVADQFLKDFLIGTVFLPVTHPAPMYFPVFFQGYR